MSKTLKFRRQFQCPHSMPQSSTQLNPSPAKGMSNFSFNPTYVSVFSL